MLCKGASLTCSIKSQNLQNLSTTLKYTDSLLPYSLETIQFLMILNCFLKILKILTRNILPQVHTEMTMT